MVFFSFFCTRKCLYFSRNRGCGYRSVAGLTAAKIQKSLSSTTGLISRGRGNADAKKKQLGVEPLTCAVAYQTLGRLSKNDADGYENVSWKVCSRCFQLYRAYFILFYMFIRCCMAVLELNSKGLYQSSGKEKESCPVFPSSTKRSIRHFHVAVR